MKCRSNQPEIQSDRVAAFWGVCLAKLDSYATKKREPYVNPINKNGKKIFDLGAMNSGMGESWCHHFCDACYRNRYACSIVNRLMGLKDTDPKYPVELIYDDDGKPICTAFKDKDKHVVKHRPPKDQEELELC